MKFESKLWVFGAHELEPVFSGQSLPFVSSFDMTDAGWIQVGTCSIECNLINPNETTSVQIKSLESQINATKAEADAKISQIQAKIDQFKSISCGGGV